MRRLGAVALVFGLLAACTSGDDDGDDGAGGEGEQEAAGFVQAEAFGEAQDEYLAMAADQFDPSSPLAVIAAAEQAERDESFDFPADEVTPHALAETFAKID